MQLPALARNTTRYRILRCAKPMTEGASSQDWHHLRIQVLQQLLAYCQRPAPLPLGWHALELCHTLHVCWPLQLRASSGWLTSLLARGCSSSLLLPLRCSWLGSGSICMLPGRWAGIRCWIALLRYIYLLGLAAAHWCSSSGVAMCDIGQEAQLVPFSLQNPACIVGLPFEMDCFRYLLTASIRRVLATAKKLHNISSLLPKLTVFVCRRSISR